MTLRHSNDQWYSYGVQIGKDGTVIGRARRLTGVGRRHGAGHEDHRRRRPGIQRRCAEVRL